VTLPAQPKLLLLLLLTMIPHHTSAQVLLLLLLVVVTVSLQQALGLQDSISAPQLQQQQKQQQQRQKQQQGQQSAPLNPMHRILSPPNLIQRAPSG
jgi:hypothetical protein